VQRVAAGIVGLPGNQPDWRVHHGELGLSGCGDRDLRLTQIVLAQSDREHHLRPCDDHDHDRDRTEWRPRVAGRSHRPARLRRSAIASRLSKDAWLSGRECS
jgi:hypothetical protein